MILLDTRGGAKEYLASLKARRLPVELQTLDSADLVIVAPDCAYTVGIELKRLTDFINSMRTGRLGGRDGQAERMARDNHFSLVLLHDEYHQGAAGVLERRKWMYGRPCWVGVESGGARGVSWAEFVKHAFALQAVRGVGWLVVGKDEVADAVVALYEWVYTDIERHSTLIKSFKQEGGVAALKRQLDRSPAQQMIMTVEGVGDKTAREIVSKFGGLRDVLRAGESGLREVKGVGPKTAKAVWEWVYRALMGEETGKGEE